MVGWWLYRRVARRAADLGESVVLWWRTCLRMTAGWLVLVAMAWFWIWQWGLLPASVVVLLAALLLLVTGPASLAKSRHRRHRRARWRPACPECGFAVRRPAGGRCPECGCAYPADPHRRRRWAWPRLAWDRVRRGGVVGAWLRTVAVVSVCRRSWRSAGC